MPESYDVFFTSDDCKRTTVSRVYDGEFDRIRAYVYRCEFQLKSL